MKRFIVRELKQPSAKWAEILEKLKSDTSRNQCLLLLNPKIETDQLLQESIWDAGMIVNEWLNRLNSADYYEKIADRAKRDPRAIEKVTHIFKTDQILQALTYSIISEYLRKTGLTKLQFHQHGNFSISERRGQVSRAASNPNIICIDSIAALKTLKYHFKRGSFKSEAIKEILEEFEEIAQRHSDPFNVRELTNTDEFNEILSYPLSNDLKLATCKLIAQLATLLRLGFKSDISNTIRALVLLTPLSHCLFHNVKAETLQKQVSQLGTRDSEYKLFLKNLRKNSNAFKAFGCRSAFLYRLNIHLET